MSTAYGQITPSADAYTNTASPTTNYGSAATLNVESASQTAYIRFDLSAIPTGYTSANIAKASLKLYVNAIGTAGSFNIDYVDGAWTESTINANLLPALGTTIASNVPLVKSNAHDYIIIDVTSAVSAWLNGTQANDGIALVANSPLSCSFTSKESTTFSHSPELDIVFLGNGAQGPPGPQGPEGPQAREARKARKVFPVLADRWVRRARLVRPESAIAAPGFPPRLTRSTTRSPTLNHVAPTAGRPM